MEKLSLISHAGKPMLICTIVFASGLTESNNVDDYHEDRILWVKCQEPS